MQEIAILLTTYNSKDYIEEQVHSLKEQTYSHWKLYVRDDLSTDNTPDMIAQMAVEDERICVLHDTVKRGALDGFMWLLAQVEADYYLFCDHDDVWLPTKVEESLKLMQQAGAAEVPVIVCTDARVVDAQLNTIDDSFWHYRSSRPAMFRDKYFHLCYNNVLGCTMCFNREARRVALPYPPTAIMHDAWLAATVLWHGGGILPIERPLMLYRLHGDNTIGVGEVPSVASQLARSSSLLKKVRRQYDASRPLTRMPFALFFLLKLKYMFFEHWYAIKISKNQGNHYRL